MSHDDFKPKLGRIRDSGQLHQLRHRTRSSDKPASPAVRALRQRGHISSATPKRGMGAGVRAAAGLIAPGSRRVIVKARYTRIVAGDLGAARAHLKYILRDGVTREGAPGQPLRPLSAMMCDGSAFLDRSEQDPHSSRACTSRPRTIRREDTFTLAPWKSALEPMRGRMVTGFIGPNRVARTLDRGRALSGPS